MMSLVVWLPGFMFIRGISVNGPMFLIGVSIQGGSLSKGVSVQEGVSFQGGLPPESEKQAACILLEYFLVLFLFLSYMIWTMNCIVLTIT